MVTSVINKIQLDATVCSLIYFTAESLYMFWVLPHPSSGVLKAVTAASGTGHNIGIATSLQRGQSMQSYLFHCKVTLHVSGVTAPIIRSTKNYNRSLRYRPYCEIQGLTGMN